jgi:YidC/Oxa1 family membrane protein insertase
MNFFDLVFYQPIVNLFYGIYILTRDVGITTICMALLIRLLMWPYVKKSYITGQKTKLVQPIIKQIQQVYKGNLQGQQDTLKKLYLKYDIKTSLSGLIILLQLPIYIALFRLIQQVNNEQYLDHLYSFFGSGQLSISKFAFGFIDITDRSSSDLFSRGSVTVFILSVLTLIFTFLMTRYIFPVSNTTKNTSNSESKNADKNIENPAEKASESLIDTEVFNKIIQFQMTYFMPVVSFVLNLNFPAGLNIYFLAGTLFSFVQQYRLATKYRIDQPSVDFDEEIIPKNLLLKVKLDDKNLHDKKEVSLEKENKTLPSKISEQNPQKNNKNNKNVKLKQKARK